MKKFTFLTIVLGILIMGPAISGFAQKYPAKLKSGKDLKYYPARTAVPKSDEWIGTKANNNLVSSKSVMEDPSMAMTRYDIQSNASVQNHIYLHPDGTIGAGCNMTHNDDWTDRGTGYNYFNGTAWGPKPSSRIENTKTGWPSYAPLGPSGEIVVSHHMTAGLMVCTRTNKGTGAWTQSILPGPAGVEDISWPRMVTNGPNHTYVHIIVDTWQTYQGLRHALLYYRSLDGGQTWDIQQRILDGMTSSEYLDFPGDTYAFAEPHGDTLAFVVGDSWNDQFIMKSTDNGDTWTKTIIWPCPYNLWAGGDTVERFWCPDGTNAIAMDNNGMAHVAFGLQRGVGASNGNKYWVARTDGLIYWNETMPQLPQDLDPDTLYAHGNYVGWCPDTNVYNVPEDSIAFYYCSMSGMPSIVTDDDQNIFLFWSGITNFRDSDSYMLRHVFYRTAYNNGLTWNDSIRDLTSDFIYNFQDCVYASASPTSDDKIYIQFQGDEYGGNYVKSVGNQGYQGQLSPNDNEMIIMSPYKTDLAVGVKDKGNTANPSYLVSPNYPNPFRGKTSVKVTLEKPASISLEVFNLTGQKILRMDKGTVRNGVQQFLIDGSQLTPGIYFYKVYVNNDSKSGKMIVE